ncbi:MAG: hypothetical protein ACRDYB_12145 [Acidimicrobiales bacterium]
MPTWPEPAATAGDPHRRQAGTRAQLITRAARMETLMPNSLGWAARSPAATAAVAAP